jgi:hypothetical protein
MKNNKVTGAEIFLYTLLIICLLSFLFINKLSAQESSGTSDQIQAEDPSPEKAAESAEKKQTLEELLAVPFNQIKKEQEEELALSGAESGAEKQSTSKKGDVKLPPPPEQRRVERDIEKQLDVIIREKIQK